MADKLKDYELLITEKPSVSLRIAQALSEKKVRTKKQGKVSYYIIERKKKKIVVAPAVGHVFTLKQEAGESGYPIFNVEWMESHKASKNSAYTKAYTDALKKLSEKATSFVSATDYDIEGELIGYNVLKFICGESALQKARRMKFSTLTREELVKSYDKELPHLDFNLANAGVARHTLDWFWGMNTSRALSYAYKAVSSFSQILSAGRVQTPTLKVLDDRELEIKRFKPTLFWVISALIHAEKKDILAFHEKEKFLDKKQAEEIHKSCNGEKAIVEKIQKQKTVQNPPFPFNLGDLQAEAYKLFKITPGRTQQIAQSLYENGLISYPRTGSQKLAGIDAKEILKKLKAISNYKKIASELFSQKELMPNEGKKTDPAHPCIYPTGEKPEKLYTQEFKLYDLIVKRFFAIFGKPAVRETQKILFKIGKETFIAKGSRTIEKNWHVLYAPYVRLKEDEFPELKEGASHKVKKLNFEEKQTQPPSRFNPASIIKKMESLGIGTKATRAQIVQTLYDRNYIYGAQIQVTTFGSEIVETIEKFVPELASEQLTKKVEDDLEQIQEGKLDKDTVIEAAKQTLAEIMKKFKAQEQKIGKRLVDAYLKSRKEQSIIGKCPSCGSDLIIRRSKATGKQFVGCSGYPKCNTSFPLPQGALIIKTEKTCPHDSLPVIQVIRKGRRRYEMCIDHKCKSKETWGNKKKKTEKKTTSKP